MTLKDAGTCISLRRLTVNTVIILSKDGKFAGNRSTLADGDQPQQFLVNSKLSGLYINNQKLVDLFLRSLPKNMKFKVLHF